MIALIRPPCPYPKAFEDSNYKHEKNKAALRASTQGKCMYCESKIGHTDYAHVEHIKPKSKFPELEFVWDNLGYSCGICNNSKKEKYDASLPLVKKNALVAIKQEAAKDKRYSSMVKCLLVQQDNLWDKS